jgi:hypothetical protein
MVADRRLATDGQLFVIRLVLPILLLAFGAGVGRIGADIVWGFIYGIGSRVVSDEKYEQLVDEVGDWGAIAGACSGLAVNALPRMWPLGAFAIAGRECISGNDRRQLRVEARTHRFFWRACAGNRWMHLVYGGRTCQSFHAAERIHLKGQLQLVSTGTSDGCGIQSPWRI